MYQSRIEALSKILHSALASPFLEYEETKKITSCGIYLIFKEEEILYVGKTGRTGKVRLRELAVDYRSHTLNKKLLRSSLSKLHNKNYPPLKRDTKKSLIAEGILTENEFVKIQSQVNKMIRTELKFKFCRIPKEEVNDFELLP